jgi:imidazolonepropionase-like amidohydrolase
MKSTLFRGCKIIDGLGGVLDRGVVLVEGQRIVYAGPDDSRHTADAVFDLDGRTLMPGMIDTHLHFVGGDYNPALERDSAAMAVLRSIPAVKRNLFAGFTTVRTGGSRDHLDIDIRNAINQGVIDGPRVLASGRGITITGGHLHDVCAEVDGVDAVRREVRYQVKLGVDSLKIMALTGGVATAGSNVQSEQFTLEELKTAVYEAHKFGKSVLSHAIGEVGIINGVLAGVDSIDHGIFLTERACDLMKEKGTFYVPTLGPVYYLTEKRQAEPWRIARAEPIKDSHVRSFKLALDKGLTIAMGSDLGGSSRFPNGENALELELMVRYGMSPMEAIIASTSNAARLLRLEDQLGSITVGKLADLIVIDADPLEDITALQDRISLVMKEGTVYIDRTSQQAGAQA